jgi:hypothetical protein
MIGIFNLAFSVGNTPETEQVATSGRRYVLRAERDSRECAHEALPRQLVGHRDAMDRRRLRDRPPPTSSPLVRVFDEALRDDLIASNPGRQRSRLADACSTVHQSYSDFVMRCALLASRGPEVAALQVGDIDS